MDKETFSKTSKVGACVGASIGSYQWAKPYTTDRYSTKADCGMMALFGGTVGALAGIAWPVGVPILISYSVAAKQWDKHHKD